MSSFLERLVERTLNPVQVLQPRLPALFEPEGAKLAAGVARGEDRSNGDSVEPEVEIEIPPAPPEPHTLHRSWQQPTIEAASSFKPLSDGRLHNGPGNSVPPRAATRAMGSRARDLPRPKVQESAPLADQEKSYLSQHSSDHSDRAEEPATGSDPVAAGAVRLDDMGRQEMLGPTEELGRVQTVLGSKPANQPGQSAPPVVRVIEPTEPTGSTVQVPPRQVLDKSASPPIPIPPAHVVVPVAELVAPRVRSVPNGERVGDQREDPVIHVSIGRIEVRAAPVPAKPRPAAIPPGPRLDDYLRRRNRGGGE